MSDRTEPYSIWVLLNWDERSGQAMLSESPSKGRRMGDYERSAIHYEAQAVDGHGDSCRCLPCRNQGHAQAYRKLIELEMAGTPILHPAAWKEGGSRPVKDLVAYREALTAIRVEATGAWDACHPVLEKIRDICTAALAHLSEEEAE